MSKEFGSNNIFSQVNQLLFDAPQTGEQIIDVVLKTVGENFQVDRVFIFNNLKGKCLLCLTSYDWCLTCKTTWEWCKPQVRPLLSKRDVDGIRKSLISVFKEKNLPMLNISDLSSVEKNLRDLPLTMTLFTAEINSLVCVPLVWCGNISGFVGMSDSQTRQWNIEEISILHHIASQYMSICSLLEKNEISERFTSYLLLYGGSNTTKSVIHQPSTGFELLSAAERISTAKFFEEYVNYISKNSTSQLFIADCQTGIFLAVNHQACTTLGYSKSQLVGQSVSILDPFLPNFETWKLHVEQMKEKKQAEIITRHRRSDNTLIWQRLLITYHDWRSLQTEFPEGVIFTLADVIHRNDPSLINLSSFSILPTRNNKRKLDPKFPRQPSTPEIQVLLITSETLFDLEENQPVQRLNMHNERKRVLNGLKRLNINMNATLLCEATLPNIVAAFAQSWDIVHISAHGDEEKLMLEDGSGCSYVFTISEFCNIVSGKAKLIFISACHSDRTAKNFISKLSKSGEHSVAVVAISGTVEDSVAKTFSETFYQSLAQMKGSIVQAFYSAKAIASSITKSETEFLLLGNQDLILSVRPGNFSESIFPNLSTQDNLPPANFKLVGRESDMVKIIRMFGKEEISKICITGFPGIGKSELAKAIGWWYRDRYKASQIIWLDAKDLSQIDDFYDKMLILLSLESGSIFEQKKKVYFRMASKK